MYYKSNVQYQITIIIKISHGLTYIIGDTCVNEISDKLHNTAVGVSVVQCCGCNGTLDYVNNDTAAEQRDRAALDKPEKTTRRLSEEKTRFYMTQNLLTILYVLNGTNCVRDIFYY